MTAELPEYAHFQDVLAPAAGGYLTPAEVQGFLVGLVGGGHRLADGSWLAALESLLNNAEPLPEDSVGLCEALYQQTCAALVEMGFGLNLYLPDEDSALPERLEALGLWCQGFLTGFSIAPKGEALSDDVNEALKDLSAISQIDVDAEQTEEMENAFTDVCEHVRLSAQLIYGELGDKPKADSGQSVH